MEKLYEGEMVRIVDVHREDARYYLRDIMKGMIVKCVRQRSDNESEWFSGQTTMYESQLLKMYGKESELNSEYRNHFKIKVERLY